MLFIKSDELKTGMRLAKPIYNKNGVMLYERNSKLTRQGIVSIQNFGLIGVYILEPAEPVPPMSEDDIEFERFQAMAIFTIRDILDDVAAQKEPKGMYPFANQVIKKYGSLYHKINFVQNLRSTEDYVYKHALNTAILCALISKKMELDFKAQLDVVVGGILHDIGELMMPLALRKIKKEERSEEDEKKINTYYYAGYQLINKDYELDAGVKRTTTLAMRDLYQIGDADVIQNTKKINEVEILKVASVFDTMTAMKFEEEPMSEITALRYLLDGANGYDQLVVQALVDSINVLQPGVCVDLSNGDKGLVITENPTDILHPFVLSFRDNQILNLADSSVASGVHIVDIMKTMDNRVQMDKETLNHFFPDDKLKILTEQIREDLQRRNKKVS